jgi:hypothetical protein
MRDSVALRWKIAEILIHLYFLPENRNDLIFAACNAHTAVFSGENENLANSPVLSRFFSTGPRISSFGSSELRQPINFDPLLEFLVLA